MSVCILFVETFSAYLLVHLPILRPEYLSQLLIALFTYFYTLISSQYNSLPGPGPDLRRVFTLNGL